MKSVRFFRSGALFTTLLTLVGCVNQQPDSSIFFGGDVFLSRAGENLFPQVSPTYHPLGVALEVVKTTQDPYFAVNLESPIGVLPDWESIERPEMNLCTTCDSIQLLVSGKVDFVAFANNHSQDCSLGGEATTGELLYGSGITSQGHSITPVYARAGEQTIAFFTLDDISDEVKVESVEVSLNQARDKSDLVVVSIHWGKEYLQQPSERQRQLAAQLVDAGADLVWGHHPHVLQPIEFLTSNKDGHQALVMYSLGNLLADQWFLPDATNSAMVHVSYRTHEIRLVSVYLLQMDFTSMQLVTPPTKQEQARIIEDLGLDVIPSNKIVVEVKNLLE